MHAYFKLDRALEAVRVNERTGETIEVIERANARLIHCLGAGPDGNPAVADPACRKRSQPMRLAGTMNFKTGRYARIVDADFQMTPYSPEALVGDLPDPPWAMTHHAVRIPAGASERDPYKRIPPPVYFEALAGITVPVTGGRVRCPAPGARRPTSILRCQQPARDGLVLPLLRGRRRDLRPRLGSTRWPPRPSAARRAIQQRPRLRRRHLRRTHLTPSNPNEGSLDAHAHTRHRCPAAGARPRRGEHTPQRGRRPEDQAAQARDHACARSSSTRPRSSSGR